MKQRRYFRFLERITKQVHTRLLMALDPYRLDPYHRPVTEGYPIVHPAQVGILKYIHLLLKMNK